MLLRSLLCHDLIYFARSLATHPPFVLYEASEQQSSGDGDQFRAVCVSRASEEEGRANELSLYLSIWRPLASVGAERTSLLPPPSISNS